MPLDPGNTTEISKQIIHIINLVSRSQIFFTSNIVMILSFYFSCFDLLSEALRQLVFRHLIVSMKAQIDDNIANLPFELTMASSCYDLLL